MGYLGWTIANVLKRLKLSSSEQWHLRKHVRDRAVAVRWRLAHVLGSFPTLNNFDVLKNLLTGDPDAWVRYGAVRSLVEMAARGSASIRKRVFEFL